MYNETDGQPYILCYQTKPEDEPEEDVLCKSVHQVLEIKNMDKDTPMVRQSRRQRLEVPRGPIVNASFYDFCCVYE